MIALHTCAAEGCTKRIAWYLLMCLPHWRMVPADLQRAIRKTWSAWCRVGRGPGRQLLEHDAACVLAVAAVREKQIKRAVKSQSRGDNLALR